MPTEAVPLQNLVNRIHQHEAELARLRQEFEARQSQLSKLTRRKEELEAQLAKVEAEMRTVGAHATSASASMSATPAKPASAAGSTRTAPAANGFMSMPKMLVHLVKEARRPLTTRDIVESLERLKYPTTSKSLHAVVEARVGELVRKGILRRAAGNQPGFILATPSSVKATHGKHPTHKTPTPVRKKTAPAKSASHGKTQPPLREVIAQVLAKASRPLSTQELADRTLATGYETKSANFKNVIWVGMGAIKNVEHVPGMGYRLKKGKAVASK